jgi:hypothetical protein
VGSNPAIPTNQFNGLRRAPSGSRRFRLQRDCNGSESNPVNDQGGLPSSEFRWPLGLLFRGLEWLIVYPIGVVATVVALFVARSLALSPREQTLVAGVVGLLALISAAMIYGWISEESISPLLARPRPNGTRSRLVSSA